MSTPVLKVALLVLGSGYCALVYQVAWLRLLRLIFGSSTPATAAVVAIFMAGIGFGSLVLGHRADRNPDPLGFYSQLELGISILAGLSPFAIIAARWAYVEAGGTAAMGPALGTVVRVLLAVAVLGLPTFLMGGTLPAVARAVERSEDKGRRLVGLLYGANTLGAVLGALATTFVSIELLGIKRTIWVAALVNLLVAMIARHMARSASPSATTESEPVRPTSAAAHRSDPRTASIFIPIAAALAGFCFFLMELVWYRMLAPILGGSSYTFGLILAVALAGIGIGGLAYGAGARGRRPSIIGFALTCSLEALLIIIPFSLGDKLAFVASVLRDLSAFGFLGLVLSWIAVTAVVVLPAALVAGYQFPLLVAILGSGGRDVGRQVGHTYAWNTLGAILGSLAGGFGLIPLLGAIGAWRLVVFVLVGLAVTSSILGASKTTKKSRIAVPVSIGLLAVVLAGSVGPTAFWRHSPIGAGRFQEVIRDRNELEDAIRFRNRVVRWEADGLESSVSLQARNGLSFYLNGKSDGHARHDAPTQVMSGIIGAVLNPESRRSLVIGLGTGSSAGWLAEMPGMKRVDVVELEPAILGVARACEPVNRSVLKNPKVNVIIGDAREVLVTSRDRYDLVLSEPSNPYRAGISSLFSTDFYAAVLDRLNENGIFIQWLQGYEIDAEVVQIALATLSSEFGSVETWAVHSSDLLLIASRDPLVHDIDRIRDVVEREPFRSALNWTWGVSGAEGLYTGYIASGQFAGAFDDTERRSINTDDRPVIEFGFARNLGRKGLFEIAHVRQLAEQRGEDRPEEIDGKIDWGLVSELLSARDVAFGVRPVLKMALEIDQRQRAEARIRYVDGDLKGACTLWETQSQAPSTPIDLVMIAECLAELGDDRVQDLAEELIAWDRSVEASAVISRWHARNGRYDDALEALLATYRAYKKTPWSHPSVIDRLFPLASEVARSSPEAARALFDEVEEPFSVRMSDIKRRALLYDISRLEGTTDLCSRAFSQYEPHVPWDQALLTHRWRCYELEESPLARAALRDLESFRSNQPLPLAWALGTPDPEAEIRPR